MQFGLLGPLSVTTDAGDNIRIGRSKLRLLLAVLLVDADRVVSADKLVESLWGHQSPRSAVANLRTYVRALRQLLSPAHPERAPIVTTSRGYSIHVPPTSVDVLVFERLLVAGGEARRNGDFAHAIRHLEEALSLWRGSAFEDVFLATDALANTAHRLEEQRLTAAENLIDARIACGQYAEVVGELHARVAQYPLRERLWEQLMLALYRDRRQAEALAAYQSLRSRLVEEVGVEPSPQLQELHNRILVADPTLTTPDVTPSVAPVAASRPPRQLPLDVATFVGRDSELATFRGLLKGDGGEPQIPVIVIHGAPGAGKSTFAVRAAKLCMADFPDGQIFLNLHGFAPDLAPMSPAEGLGRLLRAVGVGSTDVPHDVEEAASLFRTVMADRRMLIVLDNAATTAQLRPLLPAGVGSAVIVTSRARLAGLDGATYLHLGPLSPDVSYAMLQELIGEARTAADPGATRRLAALCDHLPLGLHIAASRLRTRDRWSVQHLVDRLTDERQRLTELVSGDLAVRTSLGVSCASLRSSADPAEQAAAQAFHLLGLLRVTEIELGVASALLDIPPLDTDRAIERLMDAHLIEAIEPGRYYMHDLVRLFAGELAADTVPPDDLTAAVTRGVSYYLTTARRAANLAYPHRTHHFTIDDDETPTPLDGPEEARRWLERERVNMLGVVRQALRGPDEHVRLGVGLGLALHWFFVHAGYPHDAIRVYQDVIRSASLLKERRAEAYAHDSLAHAFLLAGRLDESRAHYAAELSICRAIGDRFGEQRALGNLGTNLLTQGLPEEAIPYLEQQREVARDIGAEIGERFAALGLGKVYRRLGRLDEAVSVLSDSSAWFEKSGDDYLICAALQELGRTYIDLGRFQQAIEVLVRTAHRASAVGLRPGEAWALVDLARAWRSLGTMNKAVECIDRAVEIVATSDDTRIRTAVQAEHAEVHRATRS
ncbi:BTAD domain-containing putative transcriptional regulator [Micromonospora sp. NPDC092111]|uniref:AfsR/SARP family transcriptional regulator n=1 Tax=Micromonospora sp. NPDC092111 TaxID=3364289 RepID=UPI0037FE2A38